MNFILSIPNSSQKVLSDLGLNINNLKKRNGTKHPPTIETINKTTLIIIDKLQNNQYDIIYDICESSFLKNATFFKNVYPHKTNFIPKSIIKIIENNPNKKQILIERLNMIVTILVTPI